MNNFRQLGIAIQTRPRRLLTLILISLLVLDWQRLVNAQVSESGNGSQSGTTIQRENWLLKPAGLDLGTWPQALLNVAIERTDRAYFDSLKIDAIKAQLDDRPIELSPDMLRSAKGDKVGVLLLLDSSRSMETRSGGLSKLEATRRATLGMIESLPPDTIISVISFSEEIAILAEPTSDRQVVRAALNNYSTRQGNTHLYDGVDKALDYATRHGLKNVILLSDGCDYSPELRAAGREGEGAFKREREEQITKKAQQLAIRLFTVAIGDQTPSTSNQLYVDVDSLRKLAGLSGSSDYIELPALLRQAGGDRERYRDLLIGELESLLRRISNSFRYDYTLRLPLGSVLRPGMTRSLLKVTFRAGDQILPLEIPLGWDPKSNLPIVQSIRILEPYLIPPPSSGMERSEILAIYLILSSLLLALAILPRLGTKAVRFGARRRQRRYIEKLQSRSPRIGGRCPNEDGREWGRHLFRPGDTVITCPSCGTTHHLTCWNENGGRCWSRHCGHEMPIEN